MSPTWPRDSFIRSRGYLTAPSKAGVITLWARSATARPRCGRRPCRLRRCRRSTSSAAGQPPITASRCPQPGSSIAGAATTIRSWVTAPPRIARRRPRSATPTTSGKWRHLFLVIPRARTPRHRTSRSRPPLVARPFITRSMATNRPRRIASSPARSRSPPPRP